MLFNKGNFVKATVGMWADNIAMLQKIQWWGQKWSTHLEKLVEKCQED